MNCGMLLSPVSGRMLIDTVVFSISASAIWLAAVRFQMRS